MPDIEATRGELWRITMASRSPCVDMLRRTPKLRQFVEDMTAKYLPIPYTNKPVTLARNELDALCAAALAGLEAADMADEQERKEGGVVPHPPAEQLPGAPVLSDPDASDRCRYVLNELEGKPCDLRCSLEAGHEGPHEFNNLGG